MAYEKKNYYELSEIKSVPIPEVLARFGIKINKAGFFALRRERTPSAKYYPNTNTYCDFGRSNEGGDVIKLYSILTGVDKRDAIAAFASEFGILPASKNENGNIEMTERQYNAIGLYGDMASKNMEFDFEHYSLEANSRYSLKYQIPMNELKKRYLKKYEQLIVTKAVPYVQKMKLLLKQDMEEYFVSHEVLYQKEYSEEDVISRFGKSFSDLEYAEKTLKAACYGCINVHYKSEYASVQEMYNSLKSNLGVDCIIKILQDNPIYLEIFYSTPAETEAGREDRTSVYNNEFCRKGNRRG